jgi:diguanylate cyclase (GGDEF)-like protein/PAS domain S-box-containing protein
MTWGSDPHESGPHMSANPLSEDVQLHALMEHAEDHIYFKDRACRMVRVSQGMARALGFTDPSELLGKTDIELFGEAVGRRTFREDLQVMEADEPIVGLVECRRAEGSKVSWIRTTKMPIHDASGGVIGLLGITREVEERTPTEPDLQHLATHDELTDLPNRYLLIDRLRQTLARARRNRSIFAVLYLDVDDFGAVDALRGQEFGDLALQSLARTLVGSVRSSDTVARIDGDEFVIILETLGGRQDAKEVSQKILHNVAEPFTVDGREVRLTASIGIAFHPDNAGDAEMLLRASDYAMFLAKGEGKNRWQLCPRGMPGAITDFRAG